MTTTGTVTTRSARGARLHRSAPKRCARPGAPRAPRCAFAVAPALAAERSRSLPPRRLHQTPRGRALVLVGFALLLLAAFATGRSGSSQAAVHAPEPAGTLTQHTVAPGETLWVVAKGLAPRRDPRDVIEQISRLNHLRTPALQAGQQLLLPEVR